MVFFKKNGLDWTNALLFCTQMEQKNIDDLSILSAKCETPAVFMGSASSNLGDRIEGQEGGCSLALKTCQPFDEEKCGKKRSTFSSEPQGRQA